MSSRSQPFASASSPANDALHGSLLRSMRSSSLQWMKWIKTCADYYTAASAYKQLSALSDAELGRRGLSRATLARDVSTAYDQ